MNNYNISNRELEELKKVRKYNKKNLKKINNGYPIQYMIGYVDFFGYKINVNKNVLIPRYETELLVDKVIKYTKNLNIKELSILDLCTGSGCIGISLKKEIPNSSVAISDIKSNALMVAKKNIKEHNVNIKVIKSNLFTNIKDKYDIIVSNPPYIPNSEKLEKNVLKEPHIALFGGKTGTDILKKILSTCENYINKNGLLALEIHRDSVEELTQLVKLFLKRKHNISFEKDLVGNTRYLFIKFDE